MAENESRELKPYWHVKLMSQIQITDKCWNWLGAKDAKGYGIFTVKGLGQRAHRIVYSVFNGAIPKGQVICHSCDNPSCVNPEHLICGTVAKNNRDARERGLWKPLYGSENGNTRLSSMQVLNLKMMRQVLNWGNYRLARFFEIDPSHAWRIYSGHSWKGDSL